MQNSSLLFPKDSKSMSHAKGLFIVYHLILFYLSPFTNSCSISNKEACSLSIGKNRLMPLTLKWKLNSSTVDELMAAGAIKLVELGSDCQGGRWYLWEPCEQPPQRQHHIETISGIITNLILMRIEP